LSLLKHRPHLQSILQKAQRFIENQPPDHFQ
jgi:hypothetical protein